jgi:outer membrane immunogenic protein
MVLRALAGGLGLAVGTAISVCSAAAADLSRPPPPPPVAPIPYAPPVYNWTGIYFGGHLGAGYAGSSWSDPITGAGSDNFNSWGFLGGAQVGGNIQFDRLVLGVEGDFSWTNIKNKGTDSIGDALNTNVPWTSTVTGRVGAAFDRLLLYGKGGVAFAKDNSSITDLNTPLVATGRQRSNTTIWVLDRRR